MAILGVRVVGSGHYRDEKFSLFQVWARGSPETLTFLFGVASVFLQFWGFDRRRSSSAGLWPVRQQLISCGVVAQRQMMSMIPTIVLLYRRKVVPYSLTYLKLKVVLKFWLKKICNMKSCLNFWQNLSLLGGINICRCV